MRGLLLFLFLAIYKISSAQLLIDVGYTPSYFTLDGMDAISSDFNTSNPWLTDGLNEFHFLHGVHMRIKHQIDEISPWIEVNYQLNSNKYEGTRPGETTLSKGQVRSSLSSYLGGLEWEKDFFGIGGGVGYQRANFRLKEDDGPMNIDDKFLELSGVFATFYLSFLPAIDEDNISNLVIQPFVNIPFQASDFQAAQEYFQLDDLDGERFWQIGIRLILSNGQR